MNPVSTKPDGQPSPETAVRVAGPADAADVGQMLYEFNQEYGDPSPDPTWIASRIRRLLEAGGTSVLLVGAGPDGVAVLRFRSAIWSETLECYLAELYIKPAVRGEGKGRALLTAAIDYARSQGANYMDLGTAETDAAARNLYESLGFSNREGKPDGPINYYYERDL